MEATIKVGECELCDRFEEVVRAEADVGDAFSAVEICRACFDELAKIWRLHDVSGNRT